KYGRHGKYHELHGQTVWNWILRVARLNVQRVQKHKRGLAEQRIHQLCDSEDVLFHRPSDSATRARPCLLRAARVLLHTPRHQLVDQRQDDGRRGREDSSERRNRRQPRTRENNIENSEQQSEAPKELQICTDRYANLLRTRLRRRRLPECLDAPLQPPKINPGKRGSECQSRTSPPSPAPGGPGCSQSSQHQRQPFDPAQCCGSKWLIAHLSVFLRAVFLKAVFLRAVFLRAVFLRAVF